MKTPLLIAAACLMALLSTVGASLPYPILPPLFASDAPNSLNNFLGLPPKLLFGVALTINPLGLLLGATLMGSLSDRYGRRRVLLVTGFGGAIGHALTALALVFENYPVFIVARFVTGLAEGNGSVARALLAERLEGALRLRALSWLNGAFHAGWLVGPVLAGVTLGFGITVPFMVAVAALVLASLLVMAALPPEAPSGDTSSIWQVARERHALNLLRFPELRTLFNISLAVACGVTAFYSYYPLWLVEVGNYDTGAIATANMVMCGIMTTASLFAGRQSAVEPLRRAAWFAWGVAVTVAGVALGNLWIGLVAISLFGIPNAFYNTVVQGWAAERFSAHGQGAIMGLLSTTFCLASILTALAGALLSLLDTRLVLGLGAALCAWAGWRIGAWRSELAATRLSANGATL